MGKNAKRRKAAKVAAEKAKTTNGRTGVGPYTPNIKNLNRIMKQGR